MQHQDHKPNYSEVFKAMQLDSTLVDFHSSKPPLENHILYIIVDVYTRQILELHIQFNRPSVATILENIKNSFSPKSKLKMDEGGMDA